MPPFSWISSPSLSSLPSIAVKLPTRKLPLTFFKLIKLITSDTSRISVIISLSSSSGTTAWPLDKVTPLVSFPPDIMYFKNDLTSFDILEVLVSSFIVFPPSSSSSSTTLGTASILSGSTLSFSKLLAISARFFKFLSSAFKASNSSLVASKSMSFDVSSKAALISAFLVSISFNLFSFILISSLSNLFRFYF